MSALFLRIQTCFLLSIGAAYFPLEAQCVSSEPLHFPLQMSAMYPLASTAADEIVPPEETARANVPRELTPENENPFVNGRGLRIAGFVLLGMGLVDIAVGAVLDNNHVYADMYDDMGMRETGAMFDKIGWIAGIVETVIALPMLAAGYTQFGKWNAWEREHNKKSVKFHLHGSRMVMEF